MQDVLATFRGVETACGTKSEGDEAAVKVFRYESRYTKELDRLLANFSFLFSKRTPSNKARNSDL